MNFVRLYYIFSLVLFQSSIIGSWNLYNVIIQLISNHGVAIFQVRELLTSCGGEEFIPMFARKQISFKEIQFMEEKDLKEVKSGSVGNPTMRDLF